MSDHRMTLRDLLQRSARRDGARIAVIEQCADQEPRDVTFLQLYREVNGLAQHYVDAGLQPGDRIAVLAGNSYEFARVVLAASISGIVPACVNTQLGAEDMTSVLHDLQPAAVVGHRAHLDRHRDSINAAAITGPVWQIEPEELAPDSPAGAALPPGLSSDEPPTFGLTADDPCLILYTSGSTGRPKAVLHSHHGLVMNAWSIVTSWGFTPADRVMVGLPMYHVSMWNTTFIPSLLVGSTAVIIDRISVDTFFTKLHESRATVALGLPYMLRTMVEQSRTSPLGVPPLRIALYGMAGMPDQLADEIRNELGIAMASGFGQTESGGNTLVLADQHHDTKCGSLGRPVPNAHVELMDESGNLIEPRSNTVGELVYRGPSMCLGYFDARSSVDEIAAPWLHSGDLAREDEDGFFWFQGRLRDVIKSGGENVYAAKVEQVIASLPGVLEVAVVGRPGERWGEEVWAYVVRDETADVDEDDVRQVARQQLAPFEVPKSVVFLDQLPKSASGKIVKRRLAPEDT